MANRTAVLVALAALVMLTASFSMQAELAVAETDASSAAIAEIRAIKSAASRQIDRISAAVPSDLDAATAEPEARAIRDTAVDEIKATYGAAKDEMWQVVERTGQAEDVVAVYEQEEAALKAERETAEDLVRALYDEWKFRNDAPPAVEVIDAMQVELAEGLTKIDNEFAHYMNDLADAVSAEDADKDLTDALAKVADKVAQTRADIEREFEKRYFDPEVQEARSDLLAVLDAAAAETNAAMEAEHRAWMDEHFPPPTTTTTAPPPPPATTTTTRPATVTTTTTAPTTTTSTTTTTTTTTTSTTLPPATTTTSTPTTSTTVAVVVAPVRPPVAPEEAFLPALPVAVVDSVRVSREPPMAEVPTAMATVGFVQRVVGSQLPAGVSTVAAGPLVVLGLVFDAIRAAGTLMVVPWLLLGVYMLGLLRGWRGFRAPAA